MVVSAPTIDPRLRRHARRLSRRSLPAAAIHREIGRYAEVIGVTRPSYQQVRLLVNHARSERAARRATAQLLLEVELGVRPVSDLYPLLKE
jgi:hypothetical protein